MGAGADLDGEGGHYRDYFENCTSYTTAEFDKDLKPDLVLDARNMPEIPDGSWDCIYCSGVLEHVDDWHQAFAELTRTLKPGGILLLGLPFRQALHFVPHHYWRFTEFSIRHMLKRNYEVLEITPIDLTIADFPASYWAKARKK